MAQDATRVRLALWIGRIALAVTLLSAVADRFGLWGPPGAPHVAWGDWHHFLIYCAAVNSFAPKALVRMLAWAATILETVLALGLLAGFYLKYVAYSAAVLFGLFALAMTISFGVKAPLDYSVWADLAGTLLLGVLASLPEGP